MKGLYYKNAFLSIKNLLFMVFLSSIHKIAVFSEIFLFKSPSSSFFYFFLCIVFMNICIFIRIFPFFTLLNNVFWLNMQGGFWRIGGCVTEVRIYRFGRFFCTFPVYVMDMHSNGKIFCLLSAPKSLTEIFLGDRSHGVEV